MAIYLQLSTINGPVTQRGFDNQIELTNVELSASRAITRHTKNLGRRVPGRQPSANRLQQRMIRWWSQSESNRRPPECHSGALPTELWPRLGWAAYRLARTA